MMAQWQKDELAHIKRLENRAAKLKGKGNEILSAYCHPPQAKRTKCVCGNVVTLGRLGHREAVCSNCHRIHVKGEGSAFASIRNSGNNYQSRPGGRQGCPGVGIAE